MKRYHCILAGYIWCICGLLGAPALLAESQYTGTPISIDIENAKIENIFAILAQVANRNIVLHSDVSGTMTLKLKNVPWDQVLDLVCQDQALYHSSEGNVLIVGPISKSREIHQ